IKTSDVDVSLFSNPVVANRELIYLAVFNNQNWSIVHYSSRKGEKAHFMQMGRGFVYLPVCYASNEQIDPAAYP
ncbi:transglutaminase domain-containing protein, partial [Bacteroides thetaiotaomicron]|nr:transglutaminase domain-containing protein [Bacteroides thetaiotaomicron]